MSAPRDTESLSQYNRSRERFVRQLRQEKIAAVQKQTSAAKASYNENVRRPAVNFTVNAGKALSVLLALLFFVTVLIMGVDDIKPFEIYSDGTTSFTDNDKFVPDLEKGIERLELAFSLNKFALNGTSTAFYWIGAPFRWLGSLVSVVTKFFGG